MGAPSRARDGCAAGRGGGSRSSGSGRSRGPAHRSDLEEGDRIRPLGLDGTKSLQDLFTDRKVPRSLRHALPVVTSEGKVAWIAGVAVSAEFAAAPDAERSAVLSASQPGP